ncbi:hypothetical protein RHS04_04640 [Rhizoctonia solani]|uniref:Uncharacterized protein n=1 Tax=Rhizoctonia solani TaxID=456999 RepID=A0A8H7H6V7_9AGAM|nr:hypothetical protein RHS04_04640 [Rhizoctonia solani]
MSCRLASDLLHHPASYTPSVAARLRMSFYPTYHPIGYESWFGPPTHEPDSRSGAPGPPSLLRSRGGSQPHRSGSRSRRGRAGRG